MDSTYMKFILGACLAFSIAACTTLDTSKKEPATRSQKSPLVQMTEEPKLLTIDEVQGQVDFDLLMLPEFDDTKLQHVQLIPFGMLPLPSAAAFEGKTVQLTYNFATDKSVNLVQSQVLHDGLPLEADRMLGTYSDRTEIRGYAGKYAEFQTSGGGDYRIIVWVENDILIMMDSQHLQVAELIKLSNELK